MTQLHEINLKHTRLIYAFLTIAVLVIIGGLTAANLMGIDWELTYRPAALAMLRGQNPYAVEVAPDAPFFAAPWGLLPLIPLAILPQALGRAVLLVVSLIALAYTAQKLGAGLIGVAAFLLSPPVVHGILNANIEWIPLLGFVLPPQIGLFFISVKPQTGFAVGIFWLFEAWRTGGWRQVLKTFAPVSAALLLSFVVYGPWLFKVSNVMGLATQFNASLFPVSIPVGLVLLVAAIRRRKIELAMPASPCLSPYVLFHSWSSAVVALSAYTIEMVVATTGLWIVVIIQATG